MALNVYIHALATKYGIKPLAQMAKERFVTVAEMKYSRKSFACAVREAYTRDPLFTSELQAAIVTICLKFGIAEAVACGPLYLTANESLLCQHLCEVAREVSRFKQDLELAALRAARDKQREAHEKQRAGSYARGWTVHGPTR
ncbi:Hypothetical predicted protein [Lecanosticta acicola]|uniref:Uncharacterized protein n=1 Tax=Lecanosticta acicola TaxID=111012 RepID=A0AAI9EAI2_9PEZI|nr:Hypothetical predicted protein [Lecanosticta acicola]